MRSTGGRAPQGGLSAGDSLRSALGEASWLLRRSFLAPSFVDELTRGEGTSRRYVNDSVYAGLWEPKGLLLYLLVRHHQPEKIVETGVQYGWSSRAILSALYDNHGGNLVSIDLPTPKGGRVYDGRCDTASVDEPEDTGRVVPAYLRPRWALHLGSSEELLPGVLDKIGSIDLFFHDSEHSVANMLREFRTAWPCLRPGGILYSDDVHVNNAFATFAKEVGREGHTFRLAVGPGSVGGIRK